ncbi:MAG: TonB family protein [Candidatus Acidiferrales bacterium]
MSTQSGSSLDATERRHFARHQVKSLAYLDIGADNGGIVLNVSEGGLAVHAVSALPPEPTIGLRLQLPRSTKRLEARAKVAWTSGSKKDAGVEFIDLSEEARLEIREWLLAENAPEPAFIERPLELESPPPGRKPARTDKWTSIVAELASEGAAVIPAAVQRDNGGEQFHPPIPAPEVAAIPKAPEREPSLAAIAPGPAPIVERAGDPGEKKAGELTLAEALASELPEVPRAEVLPESESDFASGSTIPAEAFETSVAEEAPPRTLNAELSLPSDALLNAPPTTQPFTVVTGGGGGEKSTISNRSRFLRNSARSASTSDDFLKKARSLFGPKRGAGQVPENTDSTDVEAPLESVPDPAANDNAAAAVAPSQPATMLSSQPFASALPSELPRAEIPTPTESTPKLSIDTRATEVRSALAGQPAARGVPLRGSMGVMALCVIVAFVCIGLGIALGRIVFPPAPAVSGTGSAARGAGSSGSVSAASAPQNTLSANSNAGPDSRAHTRPSNQIAQSGRLHSSRTAAESSRRANTGDLNPASLAATDDDSTAAGSPPANENPSGAAAATDLPASQYKVSGTPAIPAAAPVPLPSSASSAAIAHDTAPRPQPLAERVVPAHLMYRVEPFYPKDALRELLEGTVKIHATVGQDGIVKNLRVVSGPGLLASAALDAAQYWRYIPALRNGQPVESEEEIDIEFHLPH